MKLTIDDLIILRDSLQNSINHTNSIKATLVRKEYNAAYIASLDSLILSMMETSGRLDSDLTYMTISKNKKEDEESINIENEESEEPDRDGPSENGVPIKQQCKKCYLWTHIEGHQNYKCAVKGTCPALALVLRDWSAPAGFDRGSSFEIPVKPECNKCQTFTHISTHGHYKCAVKGSCPGLESRQKERKK